MTNNITFTACKWLDYNDSYSATKNLISSDKITKVVWDRRPSDNPRLVQFCTKRGRMNGPECCLSKLTAMCRDYEEIEHAVPLEKIELRTDCDTCPTGSDLAETDCG